MFEEWKECRMAKAVVEEIRAVRSSQACQARLSLEKALRSVIGPRCVWGFRVRSPGFKFTFHPFVVK